MASFSPEHDPKVRKTAENIPGIRFATPVMIRGMRMKREEVLGTAKRESIRDLDALSSKSWPVDIAPSLAETSEIAGDNLTFRRRPPNSESIEVFEVSGFDETVGEQIYSCVALYRNGWRPDWPALGGTRWLQAAGEQIPTPEMAREEAVSLALAMFLKNNLIRKAELQLEHREQFLFGWQGGKGVVWTPWDEGGEAQNRKHLTPRRLMCHGLLIEQLRGQYIGSKDAGIGGKELRWIERATNFTIGNGCLVDTGDGTAYGVHAGMRATLAMLGKRGDGQRQMEGIPVLICGLGKVGYPLMQILQEDGAIVSIWEPSLGTTEADIESFWRKAVHAGAAIDARHFETLKSLRKSIFTAEAEALGAAPKNGRGIHFICPAGSRIEWLTESVNGSTRYEILAARPDASECIVLGPANDQLPLSSNKQSLREGALRRMTGAGILFVPDPIVSPGGVIAVSHELTAHWKAENVRNDSIHIVDKSVRMLFDLADDKRSSAAVYRAFEALALE